MMIAKLKFLGAAALACVVAVAGVQTYAVQFGGMGRAQAPTADNPLPEKSDQPAALIRRIDAIRAELAESTRRNAELEKRVEALAAELETLRSATPPDSTKEVRAMEPPAGKEGRVDEESDGKPVKLTNPPFVRIQDDLLLAISPQGDRVVAYDTATKQGKPLQLSEDKKTPLFVMPVVGHGTVTFHLEGPKVTRVAVFDIQDRNWYPVDLREPVVKATPMVSPGMVHYILGRRHYLFTTVEKRWEVLEIPKGIDALPVFERNGSITYQHNGHLYTWNHKTGQWDDLDSRAILNAPENTGEAKPKAGAAP